MPSDSEELGTINRLTHAAVGLTQPLLFLSIVAKKNRKCWLSDLKREGYAGLLFVDMKELEDQPGYSRTWWFKNRSLMSRRLVKTPLESCSSAGIFSMNEVFPLCSRLNTAMSIVSELLGSSSDDQFLCSTAQMFLPSAGGFSQDFRVDEYENESSIKYRCFWYLPPLRHADAPLPDTPDQEAIFIGSAGKNVKMFGGEKFLTMEAFYGEGERKFKLHPGDILIFDVLYPFAIDLPIGGRADGARLLSWVVYSHETPSIVIRPPEPVGSIEELVGGNEEARNFHDGEMQKLRAVSSSEPDFVTKMERMRVTPGLYTTAEIQEEVERNENIFYLDSDYFK